MRSLILVYLVLLCAAVPVHAEFDPSLLESVQSLHEEIILSGHRNINGADTAARWRLFDADVLRSLNGGVFPLTIHNLNSKYRWTDIRIPLADVGEKGDMKTGAVRIGFFRLSGSPIANKPYILAVYYHGLGVVPASTFHIFHYKHGRYELGAAMETSEFLSRYPKLQWSGIQIRMEEKPGHFSSYFNSVAPGKNRSQAHWYYNGKRLRTLRWYPEVDYHQSGSGTRISGRGDPILLN